MHSLKEKSHKKRISSIIIVTVLLTFLLLAPSAFAALRGGGSGGGDGGGGVGGGRGSGGGRGGGFVSITPTATGETVRLTNYATATIKFNRGSYLFLLVTALRDAVDVKIANKPYHISIGKSVPIDLNSDGKNDIRVSLVSVIHNLATFVVKLESSSVLPPASVQAAPSEPLPTAAAVAVPEAASSQEAPAVSALSDFVQVTREETSVGGMSVSNKLISAVLLVIAGILIFKIWQRSRKAQ